MEYTTKFTRILSRIYQLEEEHIEKLSSIDSRSSNIHKGEFEVLVKRKLIYEKQNNHAVAFAIVTEIIYWHGCIDKVKEPFSGLSFRPNGVYVCVDDGCRHHTLFRVFDRECTV